MPEGKKTAVPALKPVREEDLYSAKTHLHQPVPVQETAPAQEQNCREFLIVPEQGEAVTEQEVIQIQAAEGEIPKVPGAPMAVLPKAEGPAEENTDHHLWKWY